MGRWVYRRRNRAPSVIARMKRGPGRRAVSWSPMLVSGHEMKTESDGCHVAMTRGIDFESC